MKKTMLIMMLGAFAMTSLAACTNEVGSEGWCADMLQQAKEDPNAKWTVNEMEAFARNCIRQ